ncbi:rod shape-determining protein MreD [Candidatus Blochmannia ocreatus (nom. nud.)]|uniref:Rod shape-determining protein MreD n=1 Tax=Candidatus Blochmannia ocreatus (nom. nud.) TaxID=251538 RepID=A0ABY4SVI7_9ENTR|nr:rod shape-determining protein MreD [Candidatus Blochmannia ocreatus]URJ25357.1 rod shape-determining protein MreD [Candidatus Blochmannia ocreatus]
MQRTHKFRTIYSSFIIAIILQLIPIFPKTWYFYPSWSLMLLIYWTTICPNQVNIGTGFILGLITDIALGSNLGICSLSFSILNYLTIRKIYFFKHTPIWQQSCIIVLFSFLNQNIIFFAKILTIEISYTPKIFCNCLLDGSIWAIFIFVHKKIIKFNE